MIKKPKVNSQTKNSKEEEFLMRDFFNKSANLTLALHKEVGELRNDILVNALHIVSIKNTLDLFEIKLKSLENRLGSLNFSMSEICEASIELIDGIDDSFSKNSLKIKEFKTESEDQKENIEKLKACMQVVSSHISVLEKRNRKFSDKFKFGRWKFKSIDEEEIFNKNLKEMEQKKIHFSLNDD